MKLPFTLAAIVAAASAFPVIDNVSDDVHHKAAQLAKRVIKNLEEEFGNEPVRRAPSMPTPQDSLGISRAETNCGPHGPCPYFNEKEQYVSLEGEYVYAPPGPDEIRGPCPGLNAAANHGFLPRSGIWTIEQTVRGMNQGEKSYIIFQRF